MPIQKFCKVAPCPLFVRGEARIHDLSHERMRQPIDIQMRGGPRHKLLMREQEFQQVQFQM